MHIREYHSNILAAKAQKAHDEWLKQKEEESKKIAEKQKKLQAKKTKSEQDKENKEIEKRQKAEEKYKLWLEGNDAPFIGFNRKMWNKNVQ